MVAVLGGEVSRALNAAARRYGWSSRRNLVYEPGVIQRYQGVAVTMARDFSPYAVSYRSRRWYVHLARAVFIAWRRGCPVGTRIDTWCGSSLVTGRLQGDAMEPLCRRCVAAVPEAGGRTVRILIQVGE